MAFDMAENNGRFGRIQCQRNKESSRRGKRKRRVFLCIRAVRVKEKSKVIPANFLTIEGRESPLRRKTEERGMVCRIGW